MEADYDRWIDLHHIEPCLEVRSVSPRDERVPRYTQLIRDVLANGPGLSGYVHPFVPLP